MPMTRVNDIDVNYKLEGDGPETIVCINGLADDLQNWSSYGSDAAYALGGADGRVAALPMAGAVEG